MSTTTSRMPGASRPRWGAPRPSRSPARAAFGVEALEPRALLTATEPTGLAQQLWPVPAGALATTAPAPWVVSQADLKAEVTVADSADVSVVGQFRDDGGTSVYRVGVDASTLGIAVRLQPVPGDPTYNAQVFLLDAKGRESDGWLLESDAGFVLMTKGDGSTSPGSSINIGVARPSGPSEGKAADFALEILKSSGDNAPATVVNGATLVSVDTSWIFIEATGSEPSRFWVNDAFTSSYGIQAAPPTTPPPSTATNPSPGLGTGQGTSPPPPATQPLAPPPLDTRPAQPPAWPPPKSQDVGPPSAAEKDRAASTDLVDLDRLPERSANAGPSGVEAEPGAILASWRAPDGSPMLGAAPAGGRPTPPIALVAAGLAEWRRAALLFARARTRGARMATTTRGRGQGAVSPPPIADEAAPDATPAVVRIAGDAVTFALPVARRAPEREGERPRSTSRYAPLLLGLGGSTALFASLLLPDIDRAVEARRAVARRARGR